METGPPPRGGPRREGVGVEDTALTSAPRLLLQSSSRFLSEGVDEKSGVSPEREDALVVDAHGLRPVVDEGSSPLQGLREDVVAVRVVVGGVDVKLLVPTLPLVLL